MQLTFDNSPPDGTPGVLLGFIEGQAARDLRAPRSTRRAPRAPCSTRFARYFGARGAAPASRYVEKSWADEPWTRGCYGGYTPPGVLLELRRGAARARSAAIHWAGTETATLWNGYMDGAVQSGYRAAKEVLGKL